MRIHTAIPGLFAILPAAFLYSCGSSDTVALDKHVTITLDITDLGDQNYHQSLIVTKGEHRLILENDTRTPPLAVYLDSLQAAPMIFFYDLYLGWAICHYDDLRLHKGFAEIPKEQALLTKLRLMENPILIHSGDGWVFQ